MVRSRKLVALLLVVGLGVAAQGWAKTKKKAKVKGDKPAATAPADAKKEPAKPDAAPPAAEPAKPAASAGKALFLAQKCNKCHRVTSQGIAPLKEKDDIVDLSGIGKEHDLPWFGQWLRKEIDKDSKLRPGEKTKHKGAFAGSDAELQTLTAWLKGLTQGK